MIKKKKAAELYEEAGQLEKASKLYVQLGKFEKVISGRIVRFLQPEQVEKVYKKEGVLVGARTARKAGHLQLALKWFREAVDGGNESVRPEELEALQEFTKKNKEIFALERLAETARRLGRFAVEAEAFEELKETEKAANAFKKAAMQAEVKKKHKSQIAYLYSRAAEFFNESGLNHQVKECKLKIRQYREQPWLEVRASVSKLKPNHSSLARVVVENTGFGVARNIIVKIGEGYFETDEKRSDPWGQNLAKGNVLDEKNVYITPMNAVGDEVPLKLECFWEDKKGKEYSNWKSQPVTIRGSLSTQSNRSIVIGTYVEGGVTKIDGNQYQGDVNTTNVEGDLLQDDAQKGDRVVVGRDGKRTDVQITEDGVFTLDEIKQTQVAKIPCPVCSMLLDADAEFCVYCSTPLKDDESEE